MSDPIGLISSVGGVQRASPVRAAGDATSDSGAPSFKDVLIRNLDEVNRAQVQASEAVEDLMSGRRGDVEGVVLATEKADTAYRMLQSMRNKLMAAYEEVKSMRV